jgi:hypothetical protein
MDIGNALNTLETERETLVNHPVLGPTVSATEDRTPLKEGEQENHQNQKQWHPFRRFIAAITFSLGANSRGDFG